MADKETIYKKLSNYYSDITNSSSTDLPNDVLLKTNSKEEYEQQKLVKQQTNYLRDTWKKGERNIRQQQLTTESYRMLGYIDYEAMSKHEIIGRALEIYQEETLVTNEKGKFLNIFSENEFVQKELNNLFFNNLNFETNLPIITYETLKTGDSFLHLVINDVDGVVGCRMLPTPEIERVEHSHYEMLAHRSQFGDETFFRWASSGYVNFKYWAVAHFRLMLDQNRMPYGVSIIEKCRRVWKNLLLAEDSMLSMQILRGVDRLIHYIEVGNIDPDDVESYIDEIANNIKRTYKVDPETGQLDLKYNVMGQDQDYFIPKRGDSSSEIKKLEGQSSMDTSVVDHLMKKLMASLGIPMAYLSYEEVAGEGKTLAMQDARFAKTITRIQQCLLQEMNKIAVTHLILIGMEDEIDNFMLSMNNPSLQDQILKMEVLSQKIDLYNLATDNSAGMAAFSITKAKKEILNMTEQEIIDDLKKVRIETAVKMELDNTDQVIPISGVFKDIDAIYGSSIDDAEIDGEEDEDGDGLGGGSGMGGSAGGGVGGGDLEDIDLEDGATDEGEDDAGDGDLEDIDLTDDSGLEESIRKTLNKFNKILKG